MKKLILILLSIMLFSCSMTKQVNKTKTTETSNTVTDSVVVKQSSIIENTIKTDSSTIKTKEKIFTKYSAPDSTGKVYPIEQTIERDIAENKAVNEQSAIKSEDNQKINLKKHEATIKQENIVKKDIKKTGFRLPWWVYVIIIVVAILVGGFWFYRKKIP